MKKRTMLGSAVTAAAVAAVLVGGAAAVNPFSLATAAAEALPPLRSGYADPDPDFSQDNWGTNHIERNLVPPVLGPEHLPPPPNRD
jgi:hypothetical protein